MPYAHEYRAAALRLHRLADNLPPTARAATVDVGGFVGGPLATLLTDALAAHRASVDRAAGELDRLARICTRRAAICEAYAAELARHRRDATAWLPWSRPPAPPAWWVDA